MPLEHSEGELPWEGILMFVTNHLEMLFRAAEAVIPWKYLSLVGQAGGIWMGIEI